jgi:hypothetical protein
VGISSTPRKWISVFALERQEYSWNLNLQTKPELSVVLDKTVDPPSSSKWSVVRLDDLVKNTETGLIYVWTSNIIQVPTPRVGMLLNIYHLNEGMFNNEMYTVNDILQYIEVY